MKKIILTAAAIVLATAAWAEDYKYLTVSTSSNESSIELATVQKITFDMNEKLVVVTTSEGQVNFPISEMQKMFFSAEPTAIERLPQTSADLKVANGVLRVKGDGLLRIYNASGALQRMAKVDGSANISLDNLPAGTYIINLGKQTIKVVK